MQGLMRVLKWLMLLAGIIGMAIAVWAFVDPGAFPDARGGMLAAPSPRWRAALLFLVSLLVAGWGAGALRHRRSS